MSLPTESFRSFWLFSSIDRSLMQKVNSTPTFRTHRNKFTEQMADSVGMDESPLGQKVPNEMLGNVWKYTILSLQMRQLIVKLKAISGLELMSSLLVKVIVIQLYHYDCITMIMIHFHASVH